MKKFVGIEIGGTKLQIVIGSIADDLQATWNIEERFRFAVSSEEGANGIRRQIETTLKTLHERTIAAVGVGFGGPVDRKNGKIACSHQVEGWSDFPLTAWLQSLLSVPICVDNDANVAALGEAKHGAGIGFEPVFYVTMGSGVGGGLVADGRIYHGMSPGESEIGHLRLDRTGRIVEDSCSGWAVDRKIRQAINIHPTSALAKLVHQSKAVRGEARFLKAALEQQDPLAKQILTETAQDLAFGLSHVVHLFHPQMIILGGGLSLVGESLRAEVAQQLDGFVMQAFTPRPSISLARLGEDAVPIGALSLARLQS